MIAASLLRNMCDDGNCLTPKTSTTKFGIKALTTFGRLACQHGIHTGSWSISRGMPDADVNTHAPIPCGSQQWSRVGRLIAQARGYESTKAESLPRTLVL